VRLVNGTDYTATNGSDIVLASAASASDVLDFETFNEFNLVSQAFTNSISVEGDGTFDTAVVTVQNSTKENTDGGRESRLRFRGFRSGDVGRHTLAEIQGSHDGTGADQKGDLIFKTNDGTDNASPTEAMRLDSNRVAIVGNKISVGGGATATSPDAAFTVQDSGAAVGKITAVFGADANTNTYTDNTTKEARVGIPHYDTNEEPAALFFASSSSSANQIIFGGGTSRMNAATSIKFRTASNNTTATGTERWEITSDGHLKALSNGLGIDFSANEGSNASSSILDDYEEGTCTIAATCDSGSITFESTGDVAFYTKIGRLVTVGGRLDVNSVSSPSGQMRLTGLPYNALFGGSGELGGQSAVTIILFSPGTDIQENLCAEITNTFTTSILVRDRMGATGGVQGIANHIDSGSLLAFQATYVAA